MPTDTEVLEFDEKNPNWVWNPEANEMFLQMQENYFNHRLNSVGHVFYNEVRESLGFPPVRQGTCGGWAMASPHSVIEIKRGANTKGSIELTIAYQEDILDVLWPIDGDA